MLEFLLFIIAYLLYLPLTLINFLLVRNKGYFSDSAVTLDKLANREFRTLWNKTLIKWDGYDFGNSNETISSVLGKNIQNETLTTTGKALVFILTKKHCLDAIDWKVQNYFKPNNSLNITCTTYVNKCAEVLVKRFSETRFNCQKVFLKFNLINKTPNFSIKKKESLSFRIKTSLIIG